MQKEINKDVIAIFCADLHLTLNSPVWRSAEPDWLSAQSRVLTEIENLRHQFQCPIFAVGDLFDKAIVSTELCNWAIEHLPIMYAIPGQHDLPDHRYADIHKTGFRNLVNAKVIREIKYDEPEDFDDFLVYGFPFGKKIKSYKYKSSRFVVALVHEYRCIDGKSYKTASAENYFHQMEKNLVGYDIVVYGDNHKGFITWVNNHNTCVFNCGTLMRRKSDEIDYKPQIGLLTRGGQMIAYNLDTSQDKYIDTVTEETVSESMDMSRFFEELEKLGKSALDFVESMKEFLHQGGTCEEVKVIIRKKLGI